MLVPVMLPDPSVVATKVPSWSRSRYSGVAVWLPATSANMLLPAQIRSVHAWLEVLYSAIGLPPK